MTIEEARQLVPGDRVYFRSRLSFPLASGPGVVMSVEPHGVRIDWTNNGGLPSIEPFAGEWSVRWERIERRA